MKQTADSYRGNLMYYIITIHTKLSTNIRQLERMIETYTNQYKAQQLAPSSTQTRKNRPHNASIVSGAAGTTKKRNNRPNPNQTRKNNRKPWYVVRREKQKAKQQANRNQTRRNGSNNKGANSIKGMPKL